MITATKSKRSEVLERAEPFHHENVVGDHDEYILRAKNKPDQMLKYRDDGAEPVVEAADLYDLGGASLTVNSYNAVILNSPNLFIADVDDFCWSQVPKLYREERFLAAVRGLVDVSHAGFTVYRTLRGWRVICNSHGKNIDPRVGPVDWESLCYWFSLLHADPDYVVLCRRQCCYRARLTPKPWRDTRDGLSLACYQTANVRLEEDGSYEIPQSISGQLDAHDEIACRCDAHEYHAENTEDWIDGPSLA